MKITDENYKEVIENNNAMIYMGAGWCSGCKVVKPVIEKMELENSSSTVIGKVDVDTAAEITIEYGIRNIPAILFFKDGKVVDKIIGNTTESVIKEKMNSNFN